MPVSMTFMRLKVDPNTSCKRKFQVTSKTFLNQTRNGRKVASRVFESDNGNARRAEDPELAKMFQEAQQNIMRLNQSRLNALTELKAARKRIADLEGRLEEAVAEANESARTSNPAVHERAEVPSNSHHEYQESPLSYQDSVGITEHHEEQADPQPSVIIAYGTGWDSAYIHFKTPSRDWTQVPGMQMQQGSGQFNGSKVATISGEGRIEFVLNNGHNDWDTPDPYGEGKKNYVIDTPGTYYLKSGRLQKLG